MSLRTKWVTLALAFLMTICASLVGRADYAEAGTQYVVHKGDTLWHIAEKHDTSVSKLMKANDLTSTFINIHQTLIIPTQRAAGGKHSAQTDTMKQPAKTGAASGKAISTKPAQPGTKKSPTLVVHTVKPGDTLWRIALVNHTTVSNLMNENHLTSDIIYPGQKLKVSVPTGRVQATSHRVKTKYQQVGLPVHLIPVYKSAGAKYGIPWTVLAAIHRVETHFSTGHVVSSAGAEGPMQFMPATFRAYAVCAPGQPGSPDINNVYDAIYTAAHMLAADGYGRNPVAALYHYNHSFAYVQKVMHYAKLYQV